MSSSVLCLARDEAQASQIVDDLRKAGVSNHDVSALLPDKSKTQKFAEEKGTKSPAARGATGGAALGGALGWLVGIGALAIPGIGPFMVAGPLLTGLAGVAAGGAAGGLIGALVGLGIPESEAKTYEGRLREGRILLCVNCNDREQIMRTQEIFTRDGAEAVCTGADSQQRKAA